MSTNAAELGAVFENVLVRMLETRKKYVHVEGMALPLGMNGVAPNRILVFPLGEPPSNDDRKWRFTKVDLERAVIAFKARTEPMPILYDHGNDPAKGSKAAGWVDAVELAADGLYANVRWTDIARDEIRSGEWGFRSPGWDGEEDPLGFIYAGPLKELSLVNKPAIGGMPPVVASSQPSAQPPPEKENKMANDVTAAKKTAAMDKKGILDAIKAAFPGSDVFGDDVLAGLVADALAGGAPADPMMPGATDPAAPAVPFASAKAEDEAKAQAATAAREKELKEAKEQLAAQEARIKTLEATQLSTRIVNMTAADRPKPLEKKTWAETETAIHRAAAILRVPADEVRQRMGA